MHPKRQRILDMLQGDQEVVFLEGWDDEIVGLGKSACGPFVVVYDEDAILAKLTERAGGDFIRAADHYSSNMACASFGDDSPIFVRKVRET